MIDIQPPSQTATDAQGRLKRPWTVFIFGVLLSLGIVAVIFARSSSGGPLEDNGVIGIIAFAALAVVMSSAYALIGAKHSKALANRVVGAVGSLIALAGVGLLVWMLLKYAP